MTSCGAKGKCKERHHFIKIAELSRNGFAYWMCFHCSEVRGKDGKPT